MQINDLSIRFVDCQVEGQKFSFDFMVFDQGAMQVACYMFALILKGKGITFGPLDAKTIMEEFQDEYYATKKVFPTANQWEMVFSIEVDCEVKRQKFFCKFRNKETETMDIEVLCLQSDHGGMRIDFHVKEIEDLMNACHLIFMLLRGKGADNGPAYVNTIHEQFSNALLEQKKKDVRIKVKDVSFSYAVLYENSDQRFICYMS